jgi:hypothetical protein
LTTLAAGNRPSPPRCHARVGVRTAKATRPLRRCAKLVAARTSGVHGVAAVPGALVADAAIAWPAAGPASSAATSIASRAPRAGQRAVSLRWTGVSPAGAA